MPKAKNTVAVVDRTNEPSAERMSTLITGSVDASKIGTIAKAADKAWSALVSNTDAIDRATMKVTEANQMLRQAFLSAMECGAVNPETFRDALMKRFTGQESVFNAAIRDAAWQLVTPAGFKSYSEERDARAKDNTIPARHTINLTNVSQAAVTEYFLRNQPKSVVTDDAKKVAEAVSTGADVNVSQAKLLREFKAQTAVKRGTKTKTQANKDANNKKVATSSKGLGASSTLALATMLETRVKKGEFKADERQALERLTVALAHALAGNSKGGVNKTALNKIIAA